MGSSGAAVLLWAVIVSAVLVGFAASTDISIEALMLSNASPGRVLVNVQEECPLKFGQMRNYTIVTRRCRGPNYRASACCGGLRDFACPHAELINDVDNGCAVDMFYHLSVRGRYRPGLFSDLCHDSGEGLQCPH